MPEPDPIDGNPSDSKPKRALTEFATAEAMVQLAIALPAGCLIGGLAGAALDRHFHTSWIAVVGILLGAAAGFVQIFRTASRYMRRSG